MALFEAGGMFATVYKGKTWMGLFKAVERGVWMELNSFTFLKKRGMFSQWNLLCVNYRSLFFQDELLGRCFLFIYFFKEEMICHENIYCSN